MEPGEALVDNFDFFEKWLVESLKNSFSNNEIKNTKSKSSNLFPDTKIIIIEDEENTHKENNFIKKSFETINSNVLVIKRSDFNSNDNYILEELMDANMVFWDKTVENQAFINLMKFVKSNRKVKFYRTDNICILKNFISDITYLSKTKNLSEFTSEKIKFFIDKNFIFQIRVSGNHTILLNLSKIVNTEIKNLDLWSDFNNDENNKTNIVYYDFSDMSYSPYIMNKIQKLRKIKILMNEKQTYFRVFNANIKDIINSGIQDSDFLLNTKSLQEYDSVINAFVVALCSIQEI